MLKTALEAKEMICCGPHSLRSSLLPSSCRASDCMAWRWADPESSGDDRRGFCGLAANPPEIFPDLLKQVVNRDRPCTRCGGTGKVDVWGNDPNALEACPECQGAKVAP